MDCRSQDVSILQNNRESRELLYLQLGKHFDALRDRGSKSKGNGMVRSSWLLVTKHNIILQHYLQRNKVSSDVVPINLSLIGVNFALFDMKLQISIHLKTVSNYNMYNNQFVTLNISVISEKRGFIGFIF